MGIRLHLTARDLAGVRLVEDPGPLVDVAHAARLLRRTDAAVALRQWRRQAAELDQRAWTLLDLSPPTGLSCAFIAPLAQSIEHGLEQMRDLPRQEIADEMLDVIGSGKPSAQLRALARGEAAGWRELTGAILHIHSVLVSRIAPDLARSRRLDVLERGRVLVTRGLSELISGLHRSLSLRHGVLHVDGPYDWDVHLEGNGLCLAPSGFLIDEVRVHVPEDDGPVKLFYPVKGGLGGIGADRLDDALAALMGSTRAAILRAAADGGCGTGELAERVGVSLASASAHASVLRHAGLLSTERTGKSVRHRLTPTGALMLAGSFQA